MAKKYSTAFAATEDPLSESGTWQTRVNLLLTDMQSANGRANAKAVGAGSYDDSAALLSGYADDYEITTTVYFDGTLDTDATHECEHLIRSTQSAAVSVQYEGLYAFFGGIQCVRWFNNGGTQDFAFLTALYGPESIGGNFSNGQQFRTRIAGSAIIMSYISGGTETILGVYQDTNITSGQPGIGGYTRVLDGGDATKFCFNDAQISDIFIDQDLATDNCTRADENPLSNGGAWSTASAGSLKIVGNRIANVTANSEAIMRYTGVTPLIDYFAEVTIGTVGGGDFGPAICIQENGDCYVTTNYNGTDIYIFKVTGGASFEQLNQVITTYAPGDVIRLERFGSRLRQYVNGTKVADIEDTSFLGGHPGIFGYDGTYRISSFTCGKIIADYDAVPGSGGTTYDSTLTDTLSIVDLLLSSLVRGRNNQDTSVTLDSTISNVIHGRDGQETLTTIDTNFQSMLRGVVATDPSTVTDETILRLLFTVLAGDSSVVTDELISNAGRIIASILSSSIVIGDQVFTQMERGVITTDISSLIDQVILQLSLRRNLESDIETADAVFSFKLLTRALQDSIITADVLDALFISGTVGQFDGSKIKLGYQRKPIVISGYLLEG